MSLLFRNWLEEGFYEEDSMGDLTQISDPNEIYEARKNGTLYYHDGYSISKEGYYPSQNIDEND